SPRRPLIKLEGITRDFQHEGGDHVRALDDVSLQIGQGEFVCVTGASGSGKSTLLNIIGCLDRPTGGTYRFAGNDIARLDDDGLAAIRLTAFGFAFQSFNLLKHATARQNVELPAVYANIGGSNRERAVELLDSLGVGTRTNHRPAELSGGEQQRVAIARALVNGGQVLLADEPTGALDSKQRDEIMALMRDLSARGQTVVVVSHDPAVAAYAGRRVELRDGRIVADSGAPPRPERDMTTAPRFPVGPAGPLRSIHAAVRQAFGSLKGGLLRSALSTLSIAIGIVSVTTALGFAEGTYVAMRQAIGRAGLDRISVVPSPALVFADHRLQKADIEPVLLTVADARAIEAEVPNVRETVPSLSRKATAQSGTHNVEAGVYAYATDSLPEFMYEEWPVELGTFLSTRDDEGRRHVAVIGPGLRERLFPQRADPIGESLLLDGIPFTVKGVLAPHPIMTGRNYTAERAVLMSTFVYIPFGTAEATLFPPDARLSVDVFVHNAAKVQETAGHIHNLLMRRHGREGFQTHLHRTLLDVSRQTTRQRYAVLGGIGAVALIVSGLGVMAVMLASVSQRTREIGIRRAVGARRRDIVWQFLIESGTVALVGGTAGTILGFAAGPAIGAALDMPTAFAPWIWPAAIGLAVATGLASGIVPSVRAARLEPSVALAD
ncbi:MAG: ATP-binding cassette domain-containing protein, partial [Gammaproteobacteria bacterium]|nr:ATP-binding cassette domain-containing protein [Gammaproteobacteria bacterium]